MVFHESVLIDLLSYSDEATIGEKVEASSDAEQLGDGQLLILFLTISGKPFHSL